MTQKVTAFALAAALILLSMLDVASAQTMTPVPITKASVIRSAQGSYATGKCSTTAITAGMLLYKDVSDGRLRPATSAGTATSAEVVGAALQDCPGVDQSIDYVVNDPKFKPGFTVTVGQIYALGPAPGAWNTEASVASGQYKSLVGIGVSTTEVYFTVFNSGVTP